MKTMKTRIWVLGLAAGLLAGGGAAQAKPPAAPAAPAVSGASAVVSSGQNELIRNAEKQAQHLERAEQGKRKADAAAEQSKMRPPKEAPKEGLKPMTVPTRKAPDTSWRFGEVKAVRKNAAGEQVEDKDASAKKAARLLEKVRADSQEALLEEAKKVMKENGYYLFHDIPGETKADEGKKQVALTADMGHIESLNVTFGTNNAPEGHWYGSGQIRDRYMRGVGSGSVFNYNELYQKFYDLNSRPDLTGRLSLHAVTNSEGEVDNPEIRRLALRLNVQEEMPLHFVAGVDNNGTGTDEVDTWMARATVQYLNLWKRDGMLTLNYQNTLGDLDALGGWAASYHQKHTWFGRGDLAFTLYGSWTDVDTEDVVPDIDVEGMGWMVGFQESATVFENESRSLRISAGMVRRYVEDNLVVLGEELEGNDVTVMPVSLSAMYSEKKPDALHGMNFATVEALHEFGDFAGTADAEEIKKQRTTAKEDYTVLHVQVARLQVLDFDWLPWGGKTYGNPMLFARVNGQVASGALIPAEQFGLGGDGSVRGYATREYLGDQGVCGTLELRTPLALGLFDSKAAPSSAPLDRWQAVAFVDAGYVKIEDPLPGEEEDQTLCGAGIGLRLAVTDHYQVKCDVAFPLEKTPDSDDVCVHFSAQVQF